MANKHAAAAAGGHMPSEGMARYCGYPTRYREVMINRTLYCVTSVFTGEKQLGPTMERLAAQSVLDELDVRAKAILRA